MSTINEYQVVIESFAERHFVRTFAKKYKGAWDTTLGFLGGAVRPATGKSWSKRIIRHIQRFCNNQRVKIKAANP